MKFHKADVSNLKQRLDSDEKKILDLTKSTNFISNQTSDLKSDIDTLRNEDLARDSRVHMLEIIVRVKNPLDQSGSSRSYQTPDIQHKEMFQPYESK